MPSSVLNDIRYTRLSGGGEGASKTEGALRDVHSMWLPVMVNGKEGTEQQGQAGVLFLSVAEKLNDVCEGEATTSGMQNDTILYTFEFFDTSAESFET